MLISIIVAMDENRVIGHEGKLPWHLPADLKNFKQVTMGKPLIMGRKTHESIGKPLPGRDNIVVSAEPDYESPGCLAVHSINEALAAAALHPEAMVIGGATLYKELLPAANRIYLTEVHAEVEGDTWFPELDRDLWQEVSRSDHQSDDRNGYDFSFVVLEKNKSDVS